jgi:hypothetical protein
MRKMLGAGAAVLVLAGCGGSGNSTPLPSEAYCNDLRAGYSPFQILMPKVRDGTYTPATAADRAYGFASISCPEQLRTNQVLREYLEGWDINPDA